MTEKQLEDQDPAPRPLPLFRLVVDQARVTEDVLRYPYEGSGTTEDPFVVTYIPNDAGNPFNWSGRTRWIITSIVAIETLSVAFASSAFSGESRAPISRVTFI
jgi:hypothetical protein